MTGHSEPDAGADGQPLTPEELATLVEYGRPVIAPDGGRVAVVRIDPSGGTTEPTSTSVLSARIEGSSESTAHNDERLLPVRNQQCDPCWTTNSGALVFADRAESSLSLRVMPLDEHDLRDIPLPESITHVHKLIAHPGQPDALFVLAERTAGGPIAGQAVRHGRELWSVELSSGRHTPVCLGLPENVEVSDLAIHPHGREAVVLVPDDTRAERPATLYLAGLGPDGPPARVLCHRATRPTSRDRTLEFSPDGAYVLFSHGDERSGHRTAVVPVAGGPISTLLPDSAGTVLAACWSSERRVLAQVFSRSVSELIELDLNGAVARHLGSLHSGRPHFSVSRQTRRLAVVSGSTDGGPELSVRYPDDREHLLARANPWLRQRRTGQVSEICWASSVDGVRIDGLLVTPPGHRSGRGPSTRHLPMVVNLHGGPHFHWSRGWLGSWVDWAQMLATHGFAVLLPNPRGSTGRGWAFAHAIRGRFGELPLSDVLDGVDFLIERGVADPAALGIGGWSYGGYLTAWAISRSVRFRAAVVGAGISDFHGFMGSSPLAPAWQGFVPETRYPERAGFDLVSPLSQLDGCRTPTLVVHGERDRKVPVEQAHLLHRGLSARGVRSELLVFPGEGHVIDSAAARTDLLRMTLDWYREHLITNPPAAPGIS